MLLEVIKKYSVRLIDTSDVIEELIEIAKELKRKVKKGEDLGLSEVETSEEIKEIVKEILAELGPYVKVSDWNKKESIRAKIKMIVKKSLIKKVDSKISYEQINTIANEMLSHMEVIYAVA